MESYSIVTIIRIIPLIIGFFLLFRIWKNRHDSERRILTTIWLNLFLALSSLIPIVFGEAKFTDLLCVSVFLLLALLHGLTYPRL